LESGQTVKVSILLRPIAVDVAYHETAGPLVGYFQCRASVYTYGVGTGSCGYVCPAVACVNPWGTGYANPFTSDKSILRHNLTSDKVATVVGDMRWASSTFGTSTSLRFAFSYDKRPGSHWWCAGEGPSPLQFVWSAEGESKCANKGATTAPEKPLMKDNPMRIYANVPFASTGTPAYLSYEQKFDLMATIFYVDPAPVGYSAIADK
jgi:hypothetical protein